jgi:beta-RFAP synthase
MIDTPSVVVRGTPAEEFKTSGEAALRVDEFAAHWQTVTKQPKLPPIHIHVETLGKPHSGLGSGTQLALATAVLLQQGSDLAVNSIEQLAALVGRGRRSAVGTYGFAYGGLIVERGKLAHEAISPLDQRLELPQDWRFVLIRPNADLGLHGADEQRAFAELPAVPNETADYLNRLLDEQLLPAVQTGDFMRFSESLYEYGYRSGLCFASAQGGAYRGPRLTKLVELVRSLGVIGVGQSSWGPTLFAAVRDDRAAAELVTQLRLRDDDLSLVIAAPTVTGARLNGTPVLSTSAAVRSYDAGTK